MNLAHIILVTLIFLLAIEVLSYALGSLSLAPMFEDTVIHSKQTTLFILDDTSVARL